ncbi:hypothetical protein SDJN03_16646, partial [Cucurbita argyrosperma subsp. sororia]
MAYPLPSTPIFSPSSSTFISQEEFNLFHKIDRQLYTILTINIGRDPIEALQIMAFWLWLERAGFRNTVFRMLQLPLNFINDLANEAVAALACIASDNTPPSSDDRSNNIPLTQIFMTKEISLQILYANRTAAVEGVAKIQNEVCFRAMTDIMITAINQRQLAAAAAAAPLPSQPPSFHIAVDSRDWVPPDERAVFVTFSKGYPVNEREVREFFTVNYGDCIQMFQMQEVKPNEQALFARIVFWSAATINDVLQGQPKMKYTINGKHIWARKFIPKPPLAPSLPRLRLPIDSLWIPYQVARIFGKMFAVSIWCPRHCKSPSNYDLCFTVQMISSQACAEAITSERALEIIFEPIRQDTHLQSVKSLFQLVGDSKIEASRSLDSESDSVPNH